MASSPGPPDAPPSPAQLSGWKEIGAYLGRSVRTAQRWEKEFGLPVRRFGVSKPEAVFALPREIDAWLETAQGITARSGAASHDSVDAQADGRTAGESRTPAAFDRASLARMAASALVAAVVMGAAWFAWEHRQSARSSSAPTAPAAGPAPATWRVDLDTFIVADATGRELWRHAFPFDLSTDAYAGLNPPRQLLGGVADIDADGRREVWFVTRPANLPPPGESALYLFNSDGSVRWKYHFSGTARFGQDTFGPSWSVNRVFVTPDPAGGNGRAIWAVVYDVALFPSALLRLDPRTGRSLSAYWSNGYIITIALDLAQGRRRLFVGGCNNERKGGSLAVMDATNSSGSAPAELARYRCTSCGPGEPSVFLVFPKPPRFRPSDQTGSVERITPLPDGGVHVGVEHAVAGHNGPAVVLHTFDAAFTPGAADTADGYFEVYRTLVSQKRAAPGASLTLDPDREFFPILRWDRAAGRFAEVFRRR